MIPEEDSRRTKVGELDSTDILNLANNIGSYSKTKAEKTLKNFEKDKWLQSSENREKYYLGVRAFLELKPYFEEAYGGRISECVMCAELVLKGERCSNDKCNVKMHKHCCTKWFSGKEKKCPTCTNPWSFRS
jgi:hypothetical protein